MNDRNETPSRWLALIVLRGHADGDPRSDDRERGAAVDPARPRLLALGPRLGRVRLPDRLRRAAAARGTSRRPDRPSASLPVRAGAVLARLAAVQAVGQRGDADRRALRAG